MTLKFDKKSRWARSVPKELFEMLNEHEKSQQKAIDSFQDTISSQVLDTITGYYTPFSDLVDQYRDNYNALKYIYLSLPNEDIALELHTIDLMKDCVSSGKHIIDDDELVFLQCISPLGSKYITAKENPQAHSLFTQAGMTDKEKKKMQEFIQQQQEEDKKEEEERRRTIKEQEWEERSISQITKRDLINKIRNEEDKTLGDPR